MAMRKTRLHRLTTHVLLLSLAADPLALAQLRAAAPAWDGVAAVLHTAALPGEIDLPSSTAAIPAAVAETWKGASTDHAGTRRAVATPFGVPTTGPAGAGDAACAEDLTQRRAPLVSLVKTQLWPPSHPLVDIGLAVNVTAPCEGRVTTRVAVFADEPDEDQTGDGNVPGDARLDGSSLFLRSERKGDGDGRVYLVLTTSTLPDGTSGTACATVTVPKSRSQADLASVAAQASTAQLYCDAHQNPPPSYFKLTEGVLAVANIPPVVDAGPDQAIDFPGSAVLHGTATDDGRPNGTLSVSWSKVDGPGTVTFSSPSTAETTASFSEAGTYSLRLTADDGQFAESDDAVVVVAIANEAPHVDAGPDQEITLPADTVTLDGSATDDGKPAGSTLTTTWSVFSPAGAAVTFADAQAAQTTATLPGAGEYVLRLTADDGQFAVSDDMRVTVHAQPPPVLSIGDVAVPEGHEGATAAVVDLALSYPWPQPVTVDYLTEDGTAVAGCDYRTSFGTVTFAPGETTAELLVPIAGELAPEEDETVRIRVDNVNQATLARPEATLTILDDDAANTPPDPLSNRAPADRANSVALPPTLTWSAVDPDAGDVVTHDVHLGTSFATSGQGWARTCPTSQGPGPRAAPAAGYDEASDRLILFGGAGTADESLWILDNASAAGGPSRWTSIPTTGGPVGLGRAASAYDAATNRLFVIGGCSGDCQEGSDQTWILTHANGLGGTPTWSLLAGAGPGPRMDAAAALDPSTRRLIVFGGSNAGASLGDVWLLSLDGLPAWQALAAQGAGPARSGMTASYDGERNVLVVFGGRTGTQALSDTWVLEHANGSGGSAQWSRLTPTGTAPPARWGHVAAYDPITARLVIYGGSTASANPATRFVFRDVWMLSDAAGAGAPEWIRLSPNAGPTGQVQAAGAFSASANRLVVFGGTSNLRAATDEIWVLSDAIGTLPLVSSDAAASFTADGLVPGAVYYWRIVSRDDHGAARGSTAWRFTSNAPPSVEAGPDQTITLPASVVNLNGTGTDDGLPTGSSLTFAWTASGPGPVVFADASSAVTTATFAAPGTYVLRLTLSDSQLSAWDELTVTVLPQPAGGRTWTTTGDFAEGQSLHVNGDGDRVQLDATAGAYPFVWIAVSITRGTVVKIDARTGAILGEYFSAPDGQPRNPSRTTVDLDGNVWTANRDGNSIVHIGNEENGQCVDRNGNGVIDTSRGFGDRRPWTNAGGADTNGGISTAADECILHYTRVSAQGTRHLSVTRDNDVWVSGTATQPFDLVDGRTGFIKRSEPSVGYGGYGGLMDRNGVIWSARRLLRWDPALPLSGPNGGNWKGFEHDSYGLCIDPQGTVWETALFGPSTGNPATSGTLRKWAPDGTLLGTFGHGFFRAQGCAVDARGDVWVAHVLDGSNTVGHVKNNGAFVGNVTVPSGPTGVAVDLFGKIWTSNYNSRNASRIDPNAGPIGADGVTRVGAVDFTTPDLGGNPYNYSDMTGSTLVGAPREGRWTVVFDSGLTGAKWGIIRWSESRCGDGSLSVRVASSPDGLAFTADQPAASGQGIPVPDGRYLRVTVTFTRATSGESPILYDLSVGTEAFSVPGDDADQPPQVDAGPDQSVETPNEASLSGSACDDGRPSGALDVSWSKVSGPGDVRFSDPAQSKTRARFEVAGSFDAVEDFSETANPSGPWSYGWKPTRTGTFTLGVPSMYFGLPAWQRAKAADPNGLPVVARGPRGQTYSFIGSVLLPADLLDLHPSTTGQNAVVRWTAPAAGSYRIEGRFQGISTANPTVDVAILHNATTVFTGNITSFGQATPFSLVRNVAAGDVLDFSVGFGNGNFNNDSTGLALRVVPVGAAGVAGTYVLRLSASDAASSAQDDVTVTVTTPECVAPPAGTVGWWPADGLATDLFGGPPGTLAGGMGFGAGMVEQAFLFDGVDDAVTIPASPALNVQAFTLEGWILPNDPRVERPIFEYGSPGVFGVHLWQNLNTAIQRTAGALYANVIDAGGSFHILATGAGVLVPSTWNHVALTYDPATGKARLYANGRLQVDLAVGTFVPKTNLPFNIGHRPGTSNRFAGGIDEATVVGRALTPAEIQEIYFAGALGKCKDGINLPPRVDAGPDRTAMLRCDGKAIAALQGSVTDDGRPAGATLTSTWSSVGGPGTVTFSSPNAATTDATFSAAGDYTLRLVGSDSLLTAQDVAVVHVAAFLPPSGSFVASGILPSHNGQNGPAPVTVSDLTVGRTYSLYLWGSWAYGNGVIGNGTQAETLVSGFGNPVILLTASTSPFTSTAPLAIRRFEATATSVTMAIQDQAGFYFDNVGQLFFQIYEGVPGEPLVVNAGTDQTLTQPVSSVTLTGSVLDAGLPPAAGTSLLWTQVSGPTAAIATPASATTSVTLSQAGTYVFQLKATSCVRTVQDDVTIVIVERSDLRAASVDVSGLTVDGQTLAAGGTVSAQVANGGGGVAGAFDVTFFEDRNGNGELDPAADGLLGTASIASLGAGQTTTASAAVSGSVQFAGSPVHVFVDSGLAVPETDESNNYARSCANGCTLPDLTASFVRKAESGDSLILTARIGNGGGSTAAAGVPVSFYDRDPATVGTRITTVTTPGALAPGGFVDVSVTVPATTVARPLWVVADDQGGLVGTIDELDETNNAYNSRLFLSTTSNEAPTVDAGADQRLIHPQRTAVLDATVTDDGQPLGELTTQWSVAQRPAGATVTFADSTAVDSTATFSAAGTYVLRLTANDGQSTGSDDVTIVVEPPNQAPSVDAGPNQSITNPTTALDGTVTDDGLPTGSVVVVQWSKLQGPGTAAFANASAVDTSVTFDQEGHYVLQLSASDSAAESNDTVVIDVAFANAAPVVNAGPDRTLTLPANTLTLTGTATDDGLPLGSTLTFKWSATVSPGVVTFGAPTALETTATFSDPGVYVLKLTADDGAAKSSDLVQVTVGSAAPVGNAPQVAITAPADGVRVTAPIPVVGTATSDSLASWKLEYRLEGDTTYTRFAAGTTAVTAGPLGTFDPSLLLNGIYEVRLTGTDTAGRNSRTSIKVVIKDNLKVGPFSLSFVDLEVPVAGLPIRVTRTYDSRDKGKGDFGVGWRLDLSNVRLSEKEITGLDFEGTVSPGPFPTYCLQATRPQVVTVTTPDGKVYEFQPVLSPNCQRFAPIDGTTVKFQPLPGTNATLSAAGDGFVFVSGAWPGEMELFDGTTFDIYDPEDYVLTLPDGRKFSINQSRGLTQIKDLNGNLLTVSSAGITHSSGVGVAFTRDPQGRITRITDREGHSMSYAYDSNGDLQSVTDRENNQTSFTYNLDQPHLLDAIRDPLGKQPIRNEYYDDGRIKSHTDAFGKTITYAHDLTGRQEVITDRDGGVRVLVYDERGNVVRETNPAGKMIARTFDSRNNRTSETLPHDPGAPNPPKTTYVYDAQDNVQSVTDPENHTTTYTYNAHKQILTVKDPRGNFTVNTYDSKGNLLSSKISTSETGTPTLTEASYSYRTDGRLETNSAVVEGVVCRARYEYDGAGNLTKAIDGLDHETSYTYDRNGNRLTQTSTRTTPHGVETLLTTYQYDRAGRLVKTIDPDGSFTETVYDEAGRPKEARDKLGRITKYEYDDMGRLVRTTNPDLTTEEATYDGEDHRLTFKDRANRVTTYKYDTLGRLTKTTYPDSSFTENTYDAASRLVEVKDARGNTTFYGYDSAGRRTSVKIPLGGGAFAETVFTYDANGNQTAIRDANFHTINTEYDAQNRPSKTIFPDGTFTEFTYDTLGQRRTEKDQAGKITSFDYDCLGQLTAVTQRNNGVDLVTMYAFDEVGNRILQRDANGHETRFEYDQAGRETARVLPDGKRETKTYWPTSSLKTRTDFMGRTTSYEYDVNERLQTRTYEGNAQPAVTLTYTPTGRRKTATMAGATTQYEYDARDRLKTLTYPDGRILEYGYDANGNRTSLKATVAGQVLTTSFDYDAANRLDLVTDAVSRRYDFNYDAAGNRRSLAYPNGVATSYNYDDLNRLRNLTTTHSGTGITVQSYGFTLGPAGNRTRIGEGDGTIREYGYDDVYRVTSEKVTIDGLLQYQKDFTYDLVGNRKTQVTNGAGAAGTPTAPGSLAYGYDTRDRLLTLTLDANAPTSFAYDDNGNVTTKDGEATYTWDLDNRLVKVTRTDGWMIEQVYDADGNRLQAKITPPTGPPTITNYLVDTSGALSQVVAETEGAGALKAHYVRGDDLLAVMRPLVAVPAAAADWQTRFVHADGIGSVRRLTGESGQLTDGYSYTVFGELLAHTGSDPQPYAFAGEPYEPGIGFQYHRARWMDPRTGRFLGMDPAGGSSQDPPSLHKYLYANANPINGTDPTGLSFSLELGLSVSISGILQATAVVSVGAISGAFLSGLDAAIGGSDVREAAVRGGVIGGLTAPFMTVRVLGAILSGAGVGLSSIGAFQAWLDGNEELALFRATIAVAGAIVSWRFYGFTNVREVDPATLRWTQRRAGGNGRAAILRTSFEKSGWQGPPIDVVETPEGLVTVDHTRAAVAMEMGIDRIPVRVHQPSDPLPSDFPPNRFPGATTWGEAIAVRAGGQRPPLPPTGTTVPPILPPRE